VKRLIATLWGVVATTTVVWAADMPAVAPSAATTSEPAWTLTVASEVRYFSWQGNRGFPTNAVTLTGPLTSDGRGAELYIPFAAQLTGRPIDDFKIDIVGRGGWVWARQSTAGLTGEVATTTDTVASGTVTYLGLNGIQPFTSVSVNVPTGRSALFGPAAHARMDPDLVDIASFGEGWNVGPTVGFNLPITSNVMVTTSAGYTRRGSFVRENALTPTDPSVQTATTIDPGDVFTVTGSIGYQVGQLAGMITGSMSQETATTENGAPFVRPGRRYLVSGTWAYTWPDIGVTTLTAGAAHANRNDVLFFGASSLVKEFFNTNSNIYRAGLQHLFPVGPLRLGPTGSFLLRDHNGYDPVTLQFVPAKERWAAGVLAQFAASEKLSFNARVERVWTHEHENPAPGDSKFSVLANAPVLAFTVPVVSSTGWQVAVGANARF